jgi:thiol-disulfide isomerase/thioredoxin
MKNLFFCLFIFLILYFSNAKVLAQSTFITGNFENHSTGVKTVTIDVFNLLDKSPANYLTFVNEKTGNFSIEFPQDFTQEVVLKSPEITLTLITSPSDSLNIQLKKNGEVEFSGSNAIVNQEIFYYKKNKNWGSFKPVCEGKTLEQYKEELENWINFEKTKLAEYIVKNKTSKLFNDWATFDVVYKNANYLIDFDFHLHSKGQVLEGKLINTNVFPVDNDAALISLFYRAHLSQYFVFEYKIDEDIYGNLDDIQNLNALQFILNDLVNREKNSKSKDIMIVDFFDGLLRDDKQNSLKFIESNLKEIKNRDILNLFEQRLANLNSNNNPITLMSNQDANSEIIADVFNDITERFKGKVIYLDFWATWCGPCRSQFPYSHTLAGELEKQDVAFVFICIDSVYEKWEKTVVDLKLNLNQYFLNDLESKVLRQKFQIGGLPTYYLINKKGEIVDKEAPAPSSPITKTKIMELVSER